MLMRTPGDIGGSRLDSDPHPADTGASPQNPGLMPGSPMDGGPQKQAMMGLMMIEMGVKRLTNVLPGLSPSVMAIIEELRREVPRSLNSQSSAGMSPAGMPPPMEA